MKISQLEAQTRCSACGSWFPPVDLQADLLQEQNRELQEKITEWAGIAGTHAGTIELLQAQNRGLREALEDARESLRRRADEWGVEENALFGKIDASLKVKQPEEKKS